jgi:hypothetical protein
MIDKRPDVFSTASSIGGRGPTEMKKDVIALANLQRSPKRPSKETLNHPEIIKMASGIDPLQDTQAAYLEAYSSLGIDIINRVPETNAPTPLKPGESASLGTDYMRSYLGLYDTVSRLRYPFGDSDEFFAADRIHLDYASLITPVPHSLDKAEIDRKSHILGDIGVYYYQLYTTLFMWGVEYLGWGIFMTAAAQDPERFDVMFLEPAFEQSLKLIEVLSEVDCPFVFCHDDLADARGPVFSPRWYDEYIFPRYPELWKPAKAAGKKVIFVADGNMGPLLTALKETGIDGVMLENPATDFDLILDTFGDGIVIGGIDTGILTFSTPDAVRRHVLEVHSMTKGVVGFAMSSCGGLHGNIPLANLEAYFDARVETGHTPAGWRRM